MKTFALLLFTSISLNADFKQDLEILIDNEYSFFLQELKQPKAIKDENYWFFLQGHLSAYDIILDFMDDSHDDRAFSD